MTSGATSRPWVRFGAAFLFTGTALLIVLLMHPTVELNAFNLFQGAVFFSAWFGGLGPGLVSSVLSIVMMNYFFIPPRFAFTLTWMEGGVDLAIFGGVTLVISSLSARLRHTKAHLEKAHAELEDRIRERTAQLSDEIQSRLEAEKAILQISHREQERMGQDLHDGICQTLAALRLIASTLHKRLLKQSLPEASYVEQMDKLLGEALSRTDSISRGLYPVELEKNGFMAAVQELAQNISATHSIDCRLVRRQPFLIQNGAVATHLFRIVQEAVANAIKGGRASRILIRLMRTSSRIRVAVVDNGVGFNPEAMRQGMGLHLIRSRARLLNASFELRTRPLGGAIAVCAFDATLDDHSPEKETKS